MEPLRLIFAVLTLFAGWTTALSAQPTNLTTFEKSLARHVPRFDTSGRTLVACVVDLAYEYQLPMAIEYVDGDATKRSLNVHLHNQSLRQILEGIIRQSPKYRVDFSQGLVDIFNPESRGDASNPFNAVIRDFAVTKQETRQADSQLFCALNRQIDSSQFCGGSLAIGQWPSVQITLHLQDAKVYEILNAIVAQNSRAIWTLMVRPDELSKPQPSNLWYVYPLQPPFKSTVLERLARIGR
jgi:hypothetical protein